MNRLILLPLLIYSAIVNAVHLDYQIKDGQFYTSEGRIPSGCFGQLMTQLNGDNIVAAVFLNRNTLRGCVQANIPFPAGEEGHIEYEIINSAGENVFNIKVCEQLSGSMGTNCSRVIVEFVERKYRTKEGDHQVLSIEHRGEW